MITKFFFAVNESIQLLMCEENNFYMINRNSRIVRQTDRPQLITRFPRWEDRITKLVQRLFNSCQIAWIAYTTVSFYNAK